MRTSIYRRFIAYVSGITASVGFFIDAAFS